MAILKYGIRRGNHSGEPAHDRRQLAMEAAGGCHELERPTGPCQVAFSELPCPRRAFCQFGPKEELDAQMARRCPSSQLVVQFGPGGLGDLTDRRRGCRLVASVPAKRLNERRMAPRIDEGRESVHRELVEVFGAQRRDFEPGHAQRVLNLSG